MTGFSGRLKIIKKELGATQEQLAKYFGCSRPNVALYLRGDYKPNSKHLYHFCKKTDYSQLWLLEGKGPKKVDPPPQPMPEITRQLRAIPVISSTAGGDPIEAVDVYPPGVADEWIQNPDPDMKDPNAFALKIKGESMSPRYLDGDYVIVAPNSLPSAKKAVVFKVNGEDTGCKLHRMHGDYVDFIPANPAYEVQTYHKKDIDWIYPVVGMYRKEEDVEPPETKSDYKVRKRKKSIAAGTAQKKMPKRRN